jgi:hypothetical protein
LENSLLKGLNLKQLNRSVDLTFDQSQVNNSCLVVVFLAEQRHTSYYRRLAEFLLKNANATNNLLFVDVSFSSLRSKLESHLASLTTNREQTFSELIARAMFASFDHLNGFVYNNYFFHFSLLSWFFCV